MRALVALGSNLGHRVATVATALAWLNRLPRTRLVAASSLHETPPEAPGDGPAFINAAALLETELAARSLLDRLLALERRAGRQRGPKRGPRSLDLDLILYGRQTLRQPGLVVPHPRFTRRPFVLHPAAEIAPHLQLPQSGLSIGTLARRIASGAILS